MNTPPTDDDLPTPQTLDALRAALQSTVESLEKERQRAAAKALQNSVIGGVCVVVAWLVALQLFGSFFTIFVSFAAVIILIAVIATARGSASSAYRGGFKTLVLPPLMRAFGELDYAPHGFIPESDFRLCQLFRAPEIYHGEDLVSGRIGATALRCSQVHAEYETESENKTKQRHTIFQGLFFIADFNKTFPGMTLLFPDTAEKVFGKFGQSLQSLSGKVAHGGRDLVKLEDPEFEREFVVYSHDQIEARYVLSPSLMRRLLELKKNHGAFSACFFAGTLYLALPTTVDFFEPPPLSQPLTLASLETSIAQMRFIFGLVHDLDLNTRLWSKSAAPAAAPNAAAPNANAPDVDDAFWVGAPPSS